MAPFQQPVETQPGQDTEPDPANKPFHSVSDLMLAFKRTYFEGADGEYPGFEFGLPGLPHGGYTYLYALISIAVATAVVMLLYPLFMRHVLTVYKEEHPEDEDEGESDGKEDEAPETLMEAEVEELEAESPSKSKSRAKRSATPQPKRSSSRSSAASSNKASSSCSPSKKKK
eukprot:GEMP01035022.1.p1 GENE.GEMP01035022.1~~GEMP01035022.1.p1  ORF type:complete len:190 (+),score=51.52 GEMP01035022.1:57-572(+)